MRKRPTRTSGPGRGRRPGVRSATGPRTDTGPGVASNPGPATAGGTGSTPAVTGRSTLPGSGSEAEAERRRPRLTGRAAILVLVLAVLMVSYASSLKAYLQQRSHIQTLKAEIAERQADIDRLEREKARWDDPAYERQQARDRFGYVMPGEKSWVVLGSNGRPLDDESSLDNPADVVRTVPTAWWETAWASVELAGDPPRRVTAPAEEIDGPVAQQGRE